MVRKGCTNLTYTIASSFHNEEMMLAVDKLGKLPTKYIGGAISVANSIIVVESEAKIAFTENEAYDGGAIALQNGAIIILESHSQITFIRNHAQQYGGALYVVHVEEPTLKLRLFWCIYTVKCFFQLSPKINPQATPSLIF